MQEKLVNIKFEYIDKSIAINIKENIEFKEGDRVVVDMSGIACIGKIFTAKEKKSAASDVKFLRIANVEDLKKEKELDSLASEHLIKAKKLVDDKKLKMKMVDVKYSLDKAKLFWSFSSEGRVDFRELVKDMARMFSCKIELRQISNIDEAKVIGGVGQCGQELCCKRYLSECPKVGIKNVKNQNVSIAQNKINGVCGKIKCCFDYENDVYTGALKNMPKINSFVETPEGRGKAIYNNIPKKMVTVLFLKDDKTMLRKEFKLEEIKFEKQ